MKMIRTLATMVALAASVATPSSISALEIWAPMCPTQIIVEVQKRDTLQGIAEREYGDKAKAKLIAEGNNIPKPYALRPGQYLCLPDRTSVYIPETASEPAHCEIVPRTLEPCKIYQSDI